MKECPFCGAVEPALQIAILRVACLDCGALGPVSDDPESAWDARYSDFYDEDLELHLLSLAFEKARVARPIPARLQLDGSAESVKNALHVIFTGSSS